MDYLIDDGELSGEDNGVLNQLKGGINSKGSNGYSSAVDVLSALQKASPDGYREVCYKIGETYLFYYNVNVDRNRYQAAASWFKNSIENYPVADIYCRISDCLTNVYKYSKANQTAKLSEEYKNLWSEIILLNEETPLLDEDLKLQVWNEIVSMVSNYCEEFCQVTSPAQLDSLLNDVASKSSKITNTFLKENLDSLQGNIAVTLAKIQTVDNGQ